MKTYTERGNCARAAKKALGEHAKAGVDFNIVQTGPKEFHWTTKAAKTDAPKKKRVKGEAALKDQPQMRKILDLCGRKTGSTIEEMAERLGGVEQHTVRGSISRLNTETPGIIITVQSGRKKVYHVAATYTPKEAGAE